MPLNDDEKKLLEELSARAKEPERDDDFEIEVYDTSSGKGARVPFKTGKGWLYDTFGIGEAPAPTATGEDGGPGGDAPPAGAAGSTGRQGGYFGRK